MTESRRTFLGSMVNGLQGMALASLFSRDLYQTSDLLAAEGSLEEALIKHIQAADPRLAGGWF